MWFKRIIRKIRKIKRILYDHFFFANELLNRHFKEMATNTFCLGPRRLYLRGKFMKTFQVDFYKIINFYIKKNFFGSYHIHAKIPIYDQNTST